MNRSTSLQRGEALRLLRLMEGYGDAVLRSCCLLCGDLPRARRAAREVFLSAQPADFDGLTGRETLCGLLALTVRHCPCPAPGGPRRFSSFPHLLSLSPMQRRVAVLCWYHNLSAVEAARCLALDVRQVERLLAQVRGQLESP